MMGSMYLKAVEYKAPSCAPAEVFEMNFWGKKLNQNQLNLQVSFANVNKAKI
jgi:hypothetical protein